MSNHFLKTLKNVMSPWYPVNSQSCLSLCVTPRNLNDRAGYSKGQDLCSSADGELIKNSLGSPCWYSPGLGQRSRPMNLCWPLNSLKLLKCGVVVRGKGQDVEFRLYECDWCWQRPLGTRIWWVWIVQCLVSARSAVIRICCSTGIKGSPRIGTQGWCCAFLGCGKGAARSGVCDLCSRDSSLK